MINAHIDDRKTIPWWAAIGAPLVGIPLLVALLALSAPADRSVISEHDSQLRSEQVDAHAVDLDIEVEVSEAETSLWES